MSRICRGRLLPRGLFDQLEWSQEGITIPKKEEEKCQLFGSTSSKENQRNIALKSAEIVCQTLVDVLNVPKDDRFQVITAHPKSALPFDRDYLGVHRTGDCIFSQITLNAGRPVELTKIAMINDARLGCWESGRDHLIEKGI